MNEETKKDFTDRVRRAISIEEAAADGAPTVEEMLENSNDHLQDAASTLAGAVQEILTTLQEQTAPNATTIQHAQQNLNAIISHAQILEAIFDGLAPSLKKYGFYQHPETELYQTWVTLDNKNIFVLSAHKSVAAARVAVKEIERAGATVASSQKQRELYALGVPDVRAFPLGIVHDLLHQS